MQGDGVNIASRIRAEMGAGEIGVSKVVYDTIKNKDGLSATMPGERNLKNIAAPMILYSLDA